MWKRKQITGPANPCLQYNTGYSSVANPFRRAILLVFYNVRLCPRLPDKVLCPDHQERFPPTILSLPVLDDDLLLFISFQLVLLKTTKYEYLSFNKCNYRGLIRTSAR